MNETEKDAQIKQLKSILERLLSYDMDEYSMTIDDIEDEYPVGIFTYDYWQVLIEAKKALRP